MRQIQAARAARATAWWEADDTDPIDLMDELTAAKAAADREDD